MSTPLVARDQVIRWLSHPGPLTVCTHVHVDADAAFSAALALYMAESAGKPCTLRFLGANTVVDEADQLAVDMSNGASAIKGKGAGSAFGALVYALPRAHPAHLALKRWAQQLNITDSGKKTSDKVILATQISAWRAIGLSDAEIVDRARELVVGMTRKEEATQAQMALANEVHITAKSKIAAIGIDEKVPSWMLFKRGAKVVVSMSENGMGIILNKKEIQKGRSVKELTDHLPEGWFIHEAGFLASFGGSKNPMDPAESGITFQRLQNLAATWMNGNLDRLAPHHPGAGGGGSPAAVA